jgi:hypothetical protein
LGHYSPGKGELKILSAKKMDLSMKKELKTDLEKIAYNCRQATYLIEKKQGGELTDSEKLELKIHLASCYICRVYEQQSVIISAMVRDFLKTDHSTAIRLDDDYKNDLKRTIAHQIDAQR